ncbi:hypothetical protein DFH09DRAFT_1458082 [Mycena vulgaris]|nr:hypothetical protein DFH09DRAFT_1458082 [Mycena vulgaris]
MVRNCLAYSDQRLVDQPAAPPCRCALVAANTYTLLVRALATAARASPKITLALLEGDIVDMLYQILTGILPPAAADAATEQGDANGGQGLGGGLANMTIMESLAHRSKDQVEEMLSLILSSCCRYLRVNGVFDHKGYTEKSLGRMVKVKAKAERAAARQATHATLAAAMLIACATAAGPSLTPAAATPDDTASGETTLLRSKPAVVGRFMPLMVPILIDVYSASVITPVRVKTLTGLLKAVSFLNADGLKRVLTDHRTLVIGALQFVDLLLAKVPALYKPTFRHEGVFHEIESLSGRTIVTAAKSKDKEKEKETSESPAPLENTANLPPPPPTDVAPTIPGFKKLTSLSLEPEDAITLRNDQGGERTGPKDVAMWLCKLSPRCARDRPAAVRPVTYFSPPERPAANAALFNSPFIDTLSLFTPGNFRTRHQLCYNACPPRPIISIRSRLQRASPGLRRVAVIFTTYMGLRDEGFVH